MEIKNIEKAEVLIPKVKKLKKEISTLKKILKSHEVINIHLSSPFVKTDDKVFNYFQDYFELRKDLDFSIEKSEESDSFLNYLINVKSKQLSRLSKELENL